MPRIAIVVGVAVSKLMEAGVPVTVAVETSKLNAVLFTSVPPTFAVAETESAPRFVPACRVMVATPLAPVGAVPPVGKNTAKPLPAVLNVTTVLGAVAPELVFTVAVKVLGLSAETLVVLPTSVTVPVVVVPPVPVPPSRVAPSGDFAPRHKQPCPTPHKGRAKI